MSQKIATTLSTEEFGAASCLEGPTGASGPFFKRKQRSWIPPVEELPPIVQCAVHLVEWCRSKCGTRRNDGATLRLVGQLALGAKRHLALVEVGGVQFLVGGGSEHVTVIVPVPTGTVIPTGTVVAAANACDTAEVRGADAGNDADRELLP